VNPANGYARFHLAAWLEKCGFEEESIAQYREAVVRTPDFMPARYNFACASMKRKDPITALQMIRPVTLALPQWAEAQLVLANASYETGDAQAALLAYEAAARLNPALEIAAKNAAVLRELLSAPPSGTRVP
jgi:tetratricopeptide (TPR) repeat protein